MKINGRKPDEYAFRPSAATITYTMAYEEEEARRMAGISLPDWDIMPGTQQWIHPTHGGRCKADMIMQYRMSQWIPAAAQDALARKMEYDFKRKHH